MEREALAAILQEQNLGASDLADPGAREQFQKEFASSPEASAPEIHDNNMHCHTCFSFNGYGFSPSYIACWAKVERLFAVGQIEFDVLDGADEFTVGKKVQIIPNSSGGLPGDVFVDHLHVPLVWVPHSYNGCKQHGPDEHFLIAPAREGILAFAGMWWDLGEPGTP